MKNLFLFIIPLIFLGFIGCSDDGGTTGTDPFGGGGGGTGNVTFTVSVVQDQQQNLYFRFAPSTAIVLTQIRAQCQQIQVDETVNGDGTTIWNNGNPFDIGPVQGLQTGQQWNFTITGKIGNAQGQTFTSTVPFTVP